MFIASLFSNLFYSTSIIAEQEVPAGKRQPLDNHFIASVDSKKIKQLISMNDAVCLLLNEGKVYCWDETVTGNIELKDMTQLDLGKNAIATAIFGQAVDMQEIDTGYHACAILKNEDIRCWGVNDDSIFDFYELFEEQSKLSYNISKFTSYKMKDEIVKKMNHPKKLITNAGVICSLDQENKLFCPHPHLSFINGKTKIQSAVFGETLGCLHKLAGAVECYDMRGNSNKKSITISFNGELTAKQFTSRVIHAFGTCIIDTNDQLACWQGDYNSDVVYSTIYNIETEKMILPNKEKVIKVQLADTHACILLDEGRVNCWGENSSAQLGIEEGNTNRAAYISFPGKRLKFSLNGKVKTMAIGHGYSCFQIENKVECFGKITSM